MWSIDKGRDRRENIRVNVCTHVSVVTYLIVYLQTNLVCYENKNYLINHAEANGYPCGKKSTFNSHYTKKLI